MSTKPARRLCRLATAALVSLLAAFLASTSHAQGEGKFPSRTIKIIVGFPAGGLTDIYARVLAENLQQKLGQPVIVENKPGAGTIMASQTVANAAPDGYTLCFCVTAVATNRLLRQNVSVGIEDFTPVSLGFTSTTLLVVPKESPFSSVSELVAYARKHPGKLSYSTTGTGGATHLLGELFEFIAGIDAAAIPYKGANPATMAVATGEVDFTFSVILIAKPLLEGGKLRALGAASRERAPLFANVPTMAEAGLAGVESEVWFGLLAPKGTPSEIVEILNRETNRMFSTSPVKDQLAMGGDWPRGDLTPDQFAKYIGQDVDWHRKLIERIQLKLD